MALVFRVQRVITGSAAGVALLWGTVTGSPMAGLWAAAWIVALACGGLGALIIEYVNNRPGSRFTDSDLLVGRLVVTSGYGYIVVVAAALLAPTLLAIVLLAGLLADFLADHYVAGCRRPMAPSAA